MQHLTTLDHAGCIPSLFKRRSQRLLLALIPGKTSCRVGKTLLLRSLAYLDPLDEGELRLDDQTPESFGVTK